MNNIEERVARLEVQMKVLFEKLKDTRDLHEKSIDEIKDSLEKLTEKIEKIQWRIAMATGGAIIAGYVAEKLITLMR